MKNFIKYAIIIAVIYYAYKYYMENFSQKAKEQEAVSEQEKAAKIIVLMSDFRDRWHSYCVTYSQSNPLLPAFGQGDSPLYNSCMAEVDNRMNNVIDWDAYYISAMGSDKSYYNSLQP